MRRIGAVLCALACLVATDAAAHHRGFRGNALYYSDEYAGDAMACGPAYQPWKMVAAHRELPCGTKLRVRNLANDRVVTVTVQDRGPFTDGYVLDVSRRAARRLGFIRQGSAKIRAVIRH
ncbi:MAG TPA: septal ring lytic transglycosylase RlpA family protein [Actinomycetota bacterium]|nr:septal ring lytic transglycosylase RlpA family protein [Actinomycetota bacterium]